MSYFFYNLYGDKVKIYLDLVILLNVFFDFLLLFSVSYTLKRRAKLHRLFLGALVGATTIISLFFSFSSISLFLYKVIISILMILITFGFKNILTFLKNIFYLYIASIFLGGTLYLLNIEFSYKNNGVIFYHSGLSINIIMILIITPIIIYLYIKQATIQKNSNSNYYKVDIYITDKTIIHTTAFLDTGNNLKDPYKHRPIILINKELIKRKYKYLLVPYNSLNNHSLLKCIVPKKIIIEGHPEQTNFLIGLSEEKIMIEGAECILNKKLIERIN